MANPTVIGQSRDAGTTVLTYEFTILNGATVSDAVEIQIGAEIVGIITPAAITGTALSFQSSVDGTTYNNVYSYDDTADLSIAIAASKDVSIDPSILCGRSNLKIVSNGAEGATRKILLLTRTIN
tara:strand:+ start:118 stop:492 length:375 start_codon:yes stop_codon:yes gene_type:complete